MYRHTPLASATRAYTSGGSRAMIDTIDDNKLMQEPNKSQGMRGESFGAMEAPQNYGFTSVVADAEKSGNGMIKDCAEGFLSFMGGNRSFPMMGVMDDRRHRLMNLAKDAAKGAAAVFGLKEWGQQHLNTEDGVYTTGNIEKRIRSALVQNKNGQKQQQQQQPGSNGGAPSTQIVNPQGAYRNAEGRLVVRSAHSGIEFVVEELDLGDLSGPHVEATADGGGGNGGGNGSGGQQPNSKATGQKTLHKEPSDTWHEMNKDWHQLTRGNGNVKMEDSKTQTFHGDESTSTRCDDNHVHIRKGGQKIWVDAGGCHATVPITIVGCNDGDGGGGAQAAAAKVESERYYIYPPQPSPYDVTSSSPPIEISGGVVSMDYQAPIALGAGPSPPLILNYAPPLMLDSSQRLALGPLALDGGTF
jgi:phage gp45-like